jgi:hypothetical protein
MKNGILQTMHVEISDPSSPSMLAQLITALNNHCSHASLVDIFVDTIYNARTIKENDVSKLAIQTAHIEGLYSFHNLTAVDLSSGGYFDLDDVEIISMAKAWPNIETLLLQGDPQVTPPLPRVTLSGLTAFAEYCPKLEHLIIFFDATVIPALRSGPKIYSGSLTVLDVMNSPISHSQKVAAFLWIVGMV